MEYEIEAFKKDSMHCESNAVVALVQAIAKKLDLPYEKIYDSSFKDLIHQALKPLYNQADRLVWRLEYLFRAIQESTAGKVLTPKGGYLNAEYHKFLTTDGRIHAPGAKFKSDFWSLSLVDRDNKTIAWANLSFEDIARLRKQFTYFLDANLKHLESDVNDLKKEIESGQAAEPSDKDDLATMETS